MKKGFTLVELVIVIVIVGILSIVAVPIYRGYVEKARLTEGKALISAVRNAQMIYYAEHGAHYEIYPPVSYDSVLQIDARGNKYFKTFQSTVSSSYANAWTAATWDSINTGDSMDLFWSTDGSTSRPANADGHRLPFFRLNIDGKLSFTNS